MSEVFHASDDFETTQVPTDMCCCKAPTEREKAAAKLREMMERDSGENKCDLCKAAELLEKNDSGGNSFMALPLLMLGMLWGGVFDGKLCDPSTLRMMADVMEKDGAEKDK